MKVALATGETNPSVGVRGSQISPPLRSQALHLPFPYTSRVCCVTLLLEKVVVILCKEFAWKGREGSPELEVSKPSGSTDHCFPCTSAFSYLILTAYLKEKNADFGCFFLFCSAHSWQKVQICCNRPWPIQEGVDRRCCRAIACLENSLTR